MLSLKQHVSVAFQKEASVRPPEKSSLQAIKHHLQISQSSTLQKWTFPGFQLMASERVISYLFLYSFLTLPITPTNVAKHPTENCLFFPSTIAVFSSCIPNLDIKGHIAPSHWCSSFLVLLFLWILNSIFHYFSCTKKLLEDWHLISPYCTFWGTPALWISLPMGYPIHQYSHS